MKIINKARGPLSALCAFALLFSVAACSSSNADIDTTQIVGYWELTSVDDANGDSITEDDIASLKAMGIQISMELKSDKTVYWDLFDEEATGTWKATSATAGTMEVDEETLEFTIDNGSMTLQSKSDGSEGTMHLKKTEKTGTSES